jgi:hypothetical protein
MLVKKLRRGDKGRAGSRPAAFTWLFYAYLDSFGSLLFYYSGFYPENRES